jgi:hypothetical protein
MRQIERSRIISVTVEAGAPSVGIAIALGLLAYGTFSAKKWSLYLFLVLAVSWCALLLDYVIDAYPVINLCDGARDCLLLLGLNFFGIAAGVFFVMTRKTKPTA